MSITSYAALFRSPDDGRLGVDAVRIPMIQRDYAQGRRDPSTDRIRNDFITALITAVQPGAIPVGLDFVYGDVRERTLYPQRTLYPLDGQQRLTALFLLHWYLAIRSGSTDAPWLHFTYETRASARQFCEELRKAVCQSIPNGEERHFTEQKPAEWIKDQNWFMPGWSSEPTIASMLVVLDDIHAKLAGIDAKAALARLTDGKRPAIYFRVLYVADMGLTGDIYVRMNSRGKPLTEFEIFKAYFEVKLEKCFPERAREFASRIDGCWLDTFWAALAQGTNDPPSAAAVDAAMLRYMRFLADFVDARDSGRIAENESETDVCLRVFGDRASDKRVDWLFRAFDMWSGADISPWFSEHFRNARDPTTEGDARLPIFEPGQYGTNLFLACCKEYKPGQSATNFPMRLAFLLHAVLISGRAIDATTMQRLRTVRNLAEWSGGEIRSENMGRLIEQTEKVMGGALPDGTGFNVVQAEDERRKRTLLEQTPCLERAVHALEDHNLLRGRLLAFSLDPRTLSDHATAFVRTFGIDMDHDCVAAALLAAGDYTYPYYGVRQLAPAKAPDLCWRAILTRTLPRSLESPAAAALGAVLACVSKTNQPLPVASDSYIIRPFLRLRSSANWFDWRYYFVAYSSMRASNQGCYLTPKIDRLYPMGYVVRRHHNTGWGLRDTDPYLDAVRDQVSKELANCLITEQAEQVGFGQWLRLVGVGIKLASRQDGWRVYLPYVQQHNAAILSIFTKFNLQWCATDTDAEGTSSRAHWYFPIEQNDTVPDGIIPPSAREVTLVDREDRIARAADFITALLRVTDEAGNATTGEDDLSPNTEF